MADIEELGGLLVGEEVHWGEEALCFLDYAQEPPSDPSSNGINTGAQIIPNRPPEQAPKVQQNKRACCDDDRQHCWPMSSSVPSVAPSQPFITVDKVTEGVPRPLEDDDDDDDDSSNQQALPQESRTVGSRGARSYASRMERKATREKMRRLELNDKFNELAEVLLDVEPCRHAQGNSARHSRAPTDKGNFRVELLSRAIRAMKNLSEQAKAGRSEVKRLEKQLEAMKLAQPQTAATMDSAPAPMAAVPVADASGGAKAKSNAPMWVTVPVWMPSGGAAKVPSSAGGPSPCPMAMPYYMPQQQQPHHHQQQHLGGGVIEGTCVAPPSMNDSSGMVEEGAGARPVLKPLPPFGMPVFPPMPFMHPGFGPMTMVPPPQVDEQQEAPTHAPCA